VTERVYLEIMNSSRSIACLILAVLVTGTACSDPVSPEAEAFAQARARWNAAAISDYSFRYEQFCFCPVNGPIDILVVADSIAAATVVETGEPAPHPSGYATIDGLFDRLQSALDEDPVQFDVTYDPSFGFPASASVDISQQIADEEYSFTVQAFDPAD